MNSRLPQFNAWLAGMLILLYLAWWTSLGAPTGVVASVVLFAAVAPLAALLPSLWSANRFGTTLAGLIVPFHFAYAVMELIANPAQRGWIATQTFLALLLLVGVMASLRQVREVSEES